MDHQRVTIIIPTLEPERAVKTARQAIARAGCSKRATVQVVHDQDGEGFTRTVNRGLALVLADKPSVLRPKDAGDRASVLRGPVCLLNDDAEPVTAGWLARLLAELHRWEPFGVWFVGPSGPCRTAPQNTGRVGDKRVPRIVSHLAGFCLLIAAEALQELGGLDESFIHYCSDVDLQWRARQRGKFSLWVPDVFVSHAIHPPVSAWWQRDTITFERRWKQ